MLIMLLQLLIVLLILYTYTCVLSAGTGSTYETNIIQNAKLWFSV
jgi:hypothetical protein